MKTIDAIKYLCYRYSMRRVVQQELPWVVRGGKRRNAGRKKPIGRRCSEPHRKRERVRASEPVHVVMRCAKHVGSLRRDHLYAALRRATAAVHEREDCRIVHVSIQGSHLHLVVEARDQIALARGMQAFQISAAQHLNRAVSKQTGEKVRGKVFVDRYHAVVLRSPRQVRNTLAYVLNNWRHHGEHLRGAARGWRMDRYSSAVSFDGWRELDGKPFVAPLPDGDERLPVRTAKTWLLRTGWRTHGLISLAEIPRPQPALEG